MPQVIIKIGESVSGKHVYNLSNDKINYVLKFIDAISSEPEEEESNLLKEIEIGLKQVKKINDGTLPRKTLKQMLDGNRSSY